MGKTGKTLAINPLYKAEKPSICLSIRPSVLFGTVITQQCLYRLKWDLFNMKTVSLGITEFILTSLQNPSFINSSV